MDDPDGQISGILGCQYGLDPGFIADEDDFHAVFTGSHHCPDHIRGGKFVAPHGVNYNSGHTSSGDKISCVS